MKKTVISVVMVSLILLLTACNMPNTGKDTSNGESFSAQTTVNATSNVISSGGESLDAIVLPNDPTPKANEIIKKNSGKNFETDVKTAYSEKELVDYLYYCGSDNMNTMLNLLNEKFSIEFVRTFDDSLMYCAYKLEEGGRLFVFFHGISPKFADYVFVVKDVLHRKDFNSIKFGSTMADVENIDAGTKLVNSINTFYLDEANYSLHMVKEGFLKISYEITDDAIRGNTPFGDCKVLSAEFIENGGAIEVFDNWKGTVEYKYRFLAEDYA